jgi:hypothetical protein
MCMKGLVSHTDGDTHRFLGFYRREIDGRSFYIYRCVCGYIEAAPVTGGPGQPLDNRFEPRRDARSVAIHAPLDRGHEAN